MLVSEISVLKSDLSLKRERHVDGRDRSICSNKNEVFGQQSNGLENSRLTVSIRSLFNKILNARQIYSDKMDYMA